VPVHTWQQVLWAAVLQDRCLLLVFMPWVMQPVLARQTFRLWPLQPVCCALEIRGED
jgi:hypothetical protein